MIKHLFKLFTRPEKDPLLECLLAVKSIRVVGRGGLAQDASEVYESERFKKVQKQAKQIMGARQNKIC